MSDKSRISETSFLTLALGGRFESETGAGGAGAPTTSLD